MAVAEAFAKGLTLPDEGSFQDVLLEELDFRHRRAEVARMVLQARFHETLLNLLAVDVFTTKAPDIQKIQSANINELIEYYEAEIYQDIYAPAWLRKIRELSRRKKEEVIESAQRKANAAAKVAAMDDKTPLQPPK